MAHPIFKLPTSPILVVGDLILDEYWRGQVSRISPEAPVPVVDGASRSQTPGGAANVAVNLVHLGCEVRLCGVVGDDAAGAALLALLAEHDIAVDGVQVVAGRPTTHKLRVVSGVQHLVRVDTEVHTALPATARAACSAFVAQALPHMGGVICSDYQKGMLSPQFMQEVIVAANEFKVRVCVDPKGTDFSNYRGAHVLTPNVAELERAAGLRSSVELAAIDHAAATMRHKLGLAALLLTRGKDGMALYVDNRPAYRIPTQAKEVFDVTGAGDTVMATFAAAYFGGACLHTAAELANAAAGVVVGKLGTAHVSGAELNAAMGIAIPSPPVHAHGAHKQFTVAQARAFCAQERLRGRKVVFTNGCFDLLHAGHVHYLQAARDLGDSLIVGLNTDASVQHHKGPSRPLTPAAQRALVLAALGCVDGIVLFAEATPAALIAALLPNILVKGADYQDREVVGRDIVEAAGGRVALMPLAFSQSTTGLVKTILDRYSQADGDN